MDYEYRPGINAALAKLKAENEQLRAELGGMNLANRAALREVDRLHHTLEPEIEKLRAALKIARQYMCPMNLASMTLQTDRETVDAALEQSAPPSQMVHVGEDGTPHEGKRFDCLICRPHKQR